MVQFIKGSWHYGELDAAKMLGDDKMEIRAMGRGFVKVGGAETDPEKTSGCAKRPGSLAAGRWTSGQYDLVVLDEINYVISYHMLPVEKTVVAAFAARWQPGPCRSVPDAMRILNWWKRPGSCYRDAREVKHPYTKGILAQRGIDY